MKLTSPAFQPGETVPEPFTCDGSDKSPALTWTNPPQGTESMVLLMEDPDAPGGLFTHWVMFNIPATSSGLPEGVSTEAELSDGTVQGTNDFERIGYGGPCPLPGSPHRYFFRLYAMDYQLALAPGATRTEVLEAMGGHVLEETELMGLFARK